MPPTTTSPAAPIQENHPTASAETANPLANIYVMWFIPGRSTHTASKCFRFDSTDMQKVMARARRHCEVQNARFVRVELLIQDLDRLDNFMLNKD